MKQLVLVVDDEQGIREILQEDLLAEGFEVKTSSSIEMAMKMIRITKFDYIFSDYHMSNGDSLKLLEEARRLHPDVPFYIVSGFTEHVEETLIKKGVSGILKKPYMLSELRSLLI